MKPNIQRLTTPSMVGDGAATTDPTKVRLVDVTGDGKTDLVYLPSNGKAKIYLNNGTGGFTTASYVPGPMTVAIPDYLHFTDLDNNGSLDWLYLEYDLVLNGADTYDVMAYARVYTNPGTGVFSATSTRAPLGKLGVHATNDFSNPDSMSPNRFLITDTNDDGKPDIVHFNGGGKGVSVFIGDGLGNFGTKRKDTYADWTGLTTINPDPTTHRLADINGDGLLDWIAFNTTAGGASLYMHGKAQGAELGYDGASNRRTATAFDDATGQRFTEYYTFDTANRLVNTYRLSQVLNPTTNQLETKQNYTSERAYDTAGRVVMFKTYSAPGTLRDTTFTTYDDNNRLLKRETFLPNKETPSYTVDYSAEGSYAPDGRVLKYTVKVPGATNTYTTTYIAFEGYQQLKEIGNSSYFDSGKTNFYYDVNGRLTKVTDANDTTKYRTFIYNAQGQILQKTDYRNKNQYYQYANGNPIGSHGALTGASFDYNYTPVSEHYPASTPSQYIANAGDTLQMVAMAVYGDAKLWYLIADANGLDGSVSLKTGQVLTVPNTISNLHNDSTTFKPYNPAEIIGDTTPKLPNPTANGDNGCGVVGMIIMIIIAIVVTIFTAGVGSTLFGGAGAAGAGAGAAAGTAAVGTAAVGTTAAGVSVGGIMSAGVSVLAGTSTLSAGMSFAVGFVAGAMGSAVSQMAGVAMGNVKEFSWSAVGTSALTAGIGALGGTAFLFGGAKELGNAGAAIVNGIGNNIAAQGVNILTRQQKQFSWEGVAIGALSAAASYGIDSAFGTDPTIEVGPLKSINTSLDGRDFKWDYFAKSLGAELTKSAARQAITIAVNKDGKMNWEQVVGDGFGNSIGNAIVDQMKWNAKGEREAAQSKSAASSYADRMLNVWTDMFQNPPPRQPGTTVYADASNYTGTTTDAPMPGTVTASPSATDELPEEAYLDPWGPDHYMRGYQFGSEDTRARIIGSSDPLAEQRAILSNGESLSARDVLSWTKALAATPDDPDYNTYLNASRDILRAYGFRTGMLGTEGFLSNIGDAAERLKYVVGNDNDPRYTGQLLTSIGSALNADATEMTKRYGAFTPGPVTVTSPNGNTGTVKVNFEKGFASLAGAVGVSPEEARAKVDWRMYDAALNAAVDRGITRMDISGAWRPSRSVLNDALSTTSAVEEALTRSGYLSDYGLSGNSLHNKGQGLDFRRLNDTIINRTSNSDTLQPQIVRDFSYSFKGYLPNDSGQVIGPWMTYRALGLNSALRAPMGDGFINNLGTPGVEKQHFDHLHFTSGW